MKKRDELTEDERRIAEAILLGGNLRCQFWMIGYLYRSKNFRLNEEPKPKLEKSHEQKYSAHH